MNSASASEGTLKTRDGLELFVRTVTPVGSARATVLLTHGMGEHSGRYPHVVESLAERGYRCVVYDLRGHGRSGGARGYLRSYDHFIEDLDLVLTATTDPAQRLFLYGHSMGAQIVTNYLARRDPQVLGAVLSSPWLRLAFTPPLWKLALARATARLWPGFTQNSPQLKTNLSRDQDWIESLSNPLNHRKMSAVMFANLTAGALHASRSGPSLKIPLLLMHGEADPVTSAQATRQFYETIGSPDRTLVLWPEMRHELHNEIGRKAVLERVAEWLDSRVRRASEPEIVTSTS